MKTQLESKFDHMVKSLVKPGLEIFDSLGPAKCNLLHALLGLCGEVGEIDDTIKKHVIYNQPLDRENLIEELGDMEFYLAQLRQAIDTDRDFVLQQNMSKLAKRYPNFSYTDAHAKNRLDKIGPQLLDPYTETSPARIDE